MKKVVALLGTLDSKGTEYAFLKEQIEAQGVQTLVIDAGVLGAPPFRRILPAAEVAKAGGGDLAAARRAQGSRRGHGGHGQGRRGDRHAARRRRPHRRHHRHGRRRRHVDRRSRHAGAAGRLSEAAGLHARVGRRAALCRRQGRYDDAGDRRHRRHQPAVLAHPHQRRRRDRRHGQGRDARRSAGQAADRRHHVRRHHALRDQGARSSGSRPATRCWFSTPPAPAGGPWRN